MIVYVPANVDHRFHNVEETLTTLVLFAPAETMPASRFQRGSDRVDSPAKS